MLVLSRKVGEKVVIDGGIVLVVKKITGQRVTFGIEAPASVKIVRAELEPLPATPARETLDRKEAAPRESSPVLLSNDRSFHADLSAAKPR